MTAGVLRSQEAAAVKQRRSAAFQMIARGTLWGLALSAGLLSLTYQSCGIVCLGDAFATTALSVGAGIITVGPVTVLSAS